MVGEIYDFRLIEVEIELRRLQEQLEHIEEQIERGQERAEEELAPDTPFENEADWAMRWRQYYYEIDVILPRIWRSPFLVSMFSVYEAAVTEVAGLVQKKQGQQNGLDDHRGNFLKRAEKYFKEILEFKLLANNERWEQLKILSELRNVVAHTNGRIEMVGKERRRKIRKYEGVDIGNGYLVVSGEFLRYTFTLVKDELKDLVARYREWDTIYRES